VLSERPETSSVADSDRWSRTLLVPAVSDLPKEAASEKKVTASDGCSQKWEPKFTVQVKWTDQMDLPPLDSLVGRVC
jgi:hypothetical protein